MARAKRTDPHPKAGLVLALGAMLTLQGASAQPGDWFSRLWAPRPEPPVVAWAYDGERGPAHWGDLDTDYATCAQGRRQSPVDLHATRPVAFSPLAFRYRSQALSVVNDGRTIRVDVPGGSSLIAAGREYRLEELHFHVPAEHLVNGLRADMEMHLTHRDAHGHRAVVAVLMKAGRRRNSHLTRIWDQMPAQPGKVSYDRQKGFNPTFLLPNDRGYFTYSGSLTTPPCHEGVEWFVLAEPLEVDRSYALHLARVLGRNARPVQPLHGRTVLGVLRR